MEENKSCSSKPVMKRIWSEVQQTCMSHRLHSGVLLITLLFTFYQLSFYKHSTCMALLSFNNLCLLNVFRVVSHILGLWSDTQPTTSSYSYGLARVRVLVVFSGLVLMVMLACWSLKVMLVVWLVGVEGEPYYGCSSSGNALLLGLEVVVLTGIISTTGSGAALDTVIRATSAVASPVMALIYKLAKKYLPTPLRWKVLDALSAVRRVWFGGPLCPMLVLALTCWIMLVAHTASAALIDGLLGMGSSTTATTSTTSSSSRLVLWFDALAALSMLLLTAAYLRQPLLLTTRTLMQGVVCSGGGLQRSLHEAATVEGVLELRQAHVWSVTPHCFQPQYDNTEHRPPAGDVLAGSVLVRLHRDARTDAVVQQLQHCLQPCVQHLTLQVYKDEWLQPVTAASSSSSSSNYSSLPYDGAGQRQYPWQQPPATDTSSGFSAGGGSFLKSPHSVNYQSSFQTTLTAGKPAAPPQHSAEYPAALIRGATVTSTRSPHYVNINFPLVVSPHEEDLQHHSLLSTPPPRVQQPPPGLQAGARIPNGTVTGSSYSGSVTGGCYSSGNSSSDTSLSVGADIASNSYPSINSSSATPVLNTTQYSSSTVSSNGGLVDAGNSRRFSPSFLHPEVSAMCPLSQSIATLDQPSISASASSRQDFSSANNSAASDGSSTLPPSYHSAPRYLDSSNTPNNNSCSSSSSSSGSNSNSVYYGSGGVRTNLPSALSSSASAAGAGAGAGVGVISQGVGGAGVSHFDGGRSWDVDDHSYVNIDYSKPM